MNKYESYLVRKQAERPTPPYEVRVSFEQALRLCHDGRTEELAYRPPAWYVASVCPETQAIRVSMERLTQLVQEEEQSRAEYRQAQERETNHDSLRAFLGYGQGMARRLRSLVRR